MYYIDHDRQISSWENPLVPHLRRVVEIGRGYLQKRSGNYFEEQKAILWHQHKQDLDCWHGPFADAEGRSYFVNAALNISSWNDPRVDAQYIFELEGGLLATFSEILPAPTDTDNLSADDQPWKATNGAEVLSVEEEASPKIKRRLGRSLTESMKKWTKHNKKDEHKSILEEMAHRATLARNALKDEEEGQRLQFSRKVERRRQRRSPQACHNSLLNSSLGNGDAMRLSAAIDNTEAPVAVIESGQTSDLSSMACTPFAPLDGRSNAYADGHQQVVPESLLKFESMEAGVVVGAVR
jgi:hypothetical protein